MLKELKEIVKDLPFENIKNELDILEEKLQNKNLNIVLVGEFNAGKSSLINRYYGISLPVNSTPETATIWKIIVGDENKIIVKFKDGSEKTVEKEEEVKNFNQEDISIVEYYLKSDNNKGLILVDTPGLSSLDDFHRKALEGYIKEADVVLVLADITQGLVNSTISFLNENIENSQKLYLILTKGELLSEHDRKKQIEYIKNKFEFLKDVLVVSKDDISNLNKVLNEISKEKEKIIKERVEKKLSQICRTTLELLKEQIKLKQNASPDDLREEIKKIRNSILEIENTIRKEKVNFNYKLKNIINDFQKDFENILYSKVNWIVDALYDENLNESIDDRFQKAIQESLNEALSKLEDNFNKELNNISLNIPNTNLSENWIVNISDKTVIAREFLVDLIERIAKKSPQIYIIIVKNLKDIIRGLIDLVAESATRSFVTKQVENIIPQISEEIRNILYKQLQTILDELFEESIKDLTKQKEDYIAMLEDIYKKIDESKEQHEKEIEELKTKQKALQKLCGGKNE